MKYFCEKCGRKILKKEIPYCQDCLLAEYQRQKKVAKLKSNKNMNFKLQEAPEAPEEEPTPSEETPEEEGDEEEE